jgi:hypothetical protein
MPKNLKETYNYPAISGFLIVEQQKFHAMLSVFQICATLKSHAWHSWLGHYATGRKVVGSIPDEFTWFLNWLNHSSCTMALGLTLPLTDMSTKYLPGGKGRPARKTDNLNAICEPIY